MTLFLFHAHSGLRYLVLLVGIVALVYLGQAVIRRREPDRVGRILVAAFTGVVDLQLLLGLVVLFNWTFYPALSGHILMMVLAVVVVHVASAINKRRREAERSNALYLAGVSVALLLIVGGILAIGRSVV